MKERKAVSPAVIREAAAMREAGFTLAAISRELRVSPRTLCRHFKALKVKKGHSMAVLVDRARERLLGGLSNNEELEREVAAAIKDELALARAIREKIALAIDVLSVDSHRDAVEAARALTAASTALKTSQDVMRKALGKDNFAGDAAEDLPTLVIREMTAAEIEAERERQGAMNDDPYAMDDVLVAQS